MMLGRLQAAWVYSNAEVWRSLFDRFMDIYPDLPIEIARCLLVRPRPMRQIFVEAGRYTPLDKMRADVATFLDFPKDAKTAIKQIKPEYFIGDYAIALLFSEIDEGLRAAYDNPELTRYYCDRLESFFSGTCCHTGWTGSP